MKEEPRGFAQETTVAGRTRRAQKPFGIPHDLRGDHEVVALARPEMTETCTGQVSSSAAVVVPEAGCACEQSPRPRYRKQPKAITIGVAEEK